MMTLNNIIDQIRTNSDLDLTHILNDLDTDDYNRDMNNITNNCMYYTPDSLNNIYTRDLLNNTQNNFSLLSLNCQSLKTHWDAFSSMLHQAGTSGFLPDVIGLTEVFKIPSHLCFDINGYKPLITKT